jgi:hypothetical protein
VLVRRSGAGKEGAGGTEEYTVGDTHKHRYNCEDLKLEAAQVMIALYRGSSTSPMVEIKVDRQ